MNAPHRVLLLMDEGPARNALAGEMERAGWRASPLAAPGDVLSSAAGADADAILLDADLTGVRDAPGGLLGLCRALRAAAPHAAILLTAAGDAAAALAGEAVAAGADECLARPFRADHLARRLEAALRGRAPARDAGVPLGPFVFRATAKQLVHAEGRVVRLTEKEAALLECLRRAHPDPVPRQTLLAEIWGYGAGIDTHTLQTHVYRLRRKIGADEGARLLLSDEGGYRLSL